MKTLYKHLTSEDRFRLYERTGLPKVHYKTNLSLIKDSFAYKKSVVSYLENIDNCIKKGQGLVLYGEYSSGKSGIAALCMKAAINYGHIGFWVRCLDITADKIEKNMFDENTSVYDRCLEVPILVIDEVIIKKNVAYSEILLEEVIRHRIDDVKTTIITSNHTLKDLEDRHPALMAALSESCFPINVKGWDYRKSEKPKEKPKKRTNSDGTTNIW